MDFTAVTITDLSDNVKESVYASIKSFLKYHNNKLIIYIIGDNEFLLNDDRIEIIRLPKKDYNLNENISNNYFQQIMNILVEKMLIFSRHENFMFFENDVFFFDSMQSVWDNVKDGITGSSSTYGLNNHFKYPFINTGLFFVKNFKFNYTFNDIKNYFENNDTTWPDEEFLHHFIDKKDVHFLSQDDNVMTDIHKNYSKPVVNTKSIHFTGFPKPPKFPEPQEYLKVHTRRKFLPLYRKVYDLFN